MDPRKQSEDYRNMVYSSETGGQSKQQEQKHELQLGKGKSWVPQFWNRGWKRPSSRKKSRQEESGWEML